MGFFFLIAAAVLFFFAGVGVTVIPNPTTWGLFCFVLGVLLSGVPMPTWKR